MLKSRLQLFFQKLKLFIPGIKNRIIIDDNTRKFINLNKKKWSNKKSSNKVVLVDKFSWPPWIFYFSYLTNYLSTKTNSKIEYFYFPLKPTWLDKFLIPDRRLNAIYKSFGCAKGMTSLNFFSYYQESSSMGNAIFKNLNIKSDILKIKFKNILIGDLIYDTYTRNTSKPTVDLKDPYLNKIIIRAIKISLICENYFKKNEVIAIIPSHNVYISFGIIVRLGALNNIPSYRINSRQRGMTQFNLIQITPPYFLGVQPYYEFSNIFSQLSENTKLKALKLGKKLLDDRLSGKIDSGIHYMKKSSYSKNYISNVFINNNKPNIVVLLHCFFDSPHRYRDMIFSDFYEWICFTIEESAKTDFNWYIKPHPNGLPGNNEIIEQLKLKYPFVSFVNEDISNLQLVEEGVSSIFTVFGTAGHEFAYLGIPVVNAGDNPHISYEFNYNPKNITEYKELIHNANNLKININKEEVSQFAYMYYLHFDEIDSTKYESKIHDSDFINPELGVNQYSIEIFNFS